MSQVLIATPTPTLAEGFASAVRFFKADADNVRFLNGYVASTEFERELRAALDELPADGGPVVVCTDIPGGSVNQVSMRLADEYGFLLVSGVNMPLLLELAFEDEPTYESLAQSGGERPGPAHASPRGHPDARGGRTGGGAMTRTARSSSPGRTGLAIDEKNRERSRT